MSYRTETTTEYVWARRDVDGSPWQMARIVPGGVMVDGELWRDDRK